LCWHALSPISSVSNKRRRSRSQRIPVTPHLRRIGLYQVTGSLLKEHNPLYLQPITDSTLDSSILNEQKEEWQGEVTEFVTRCNLAAKVRLLHWSNRRRSACRGSGSMRVGFGPGLACHIPYLFRRAVQTDHRRAIAPATSKARVTNTRHLWRLCKDCSSDCQSWRWLRAISATIVRDHLVKASPREA